MAHDHAHSHSDARWRVAVAAVLTFAFMGVEVVGGILSGSLALLADAAHMLTDAGSLTLAWIGYYLAERPADERRSYGFARFKILAAFVNGLALIALAVWIVFEAGMRLLEPQPVIGSLMLWVAAGGLLVNIAAFAVLHGGDQHDLNLSGALWHVAGDLLGSVAAIAAALIIISTGWTPIDPILSALVAGLITWAGLRIVRKSGHILLQGAPEALSSAAIIADLEALIPDAARVSHVHAWQLTEAKPMVTLEVTCATGACPETLRRDIKARLKKAFDVSHATVEVVSEPI
ncbi:MAG: cation diffusion facilitator family transporter [Pseudomonadota bacterium]